MNAPSMPRNPRQLLSDTATAMFLERGFDGVRVAEVAAACGVSERRSAITSRSRKPSSWTARRPPWATQGREAIRRFGDLIRAIPALRAYQADMTDQAAAAAGRMLAARAGMTAADPEPQIAARALLGLWRVQADSLRRHLDHAATPALLHQLVTADVHRAARLIDTGLRGLFAPARG